MIELHNGKFTYFYKKFVLFLCDTAAKKIKKMRVFIYLFFFVNVNHQ